VLSRIRNLGLEKDVREIPSHKDFNVQHLELVHLYMLSRNISKI